MNNGSLLTKPIYWEFIFRCDEEFSEIIIALISDYNFESFSYDDQLHAFLQDYEELDVIELHSNIEQVLLEIGYSKNIIYKNIESKNWNETWEKNFTPVHIGDNCVIRAPFHEQIDNRLNIIIEPKMSFGTGHHQTTYLMMSELFNIDLTNKTMLDMGCGTAVLAILSEKLNANSVIGVDIEDWAYENSLENVALNNCNNIEIRKGGVDKILNDKFDIILANINKNVLIKDMNTYSKILNQNGYMFLSGFFETDSAEIIKSAEINHLRFEKIITLEEWALVKIIKKG